MEQSIQKLHELYLKRSDLQPASIRFKNKSLGYFLGWFGDRAVQDVTPAIAEDYRVLLSKGRKKVSANGYLANFKPFWQWLLRHNYIKYDPFESLKPFKVTETEKETFSSQELGRMIMLCDRLWRVRICLGLMGCRRGEVMNLTVREIHMEPGRDSYIHLCQKEESENTWHWQLKNHKVRMVALPERMCFDGVIVNLHTDIIRLIEELENGQPYLCLEKKYYDRMIKRQRENTIEDWRSVDQTGNYQRSFNNIQRRAAVKPTRRFHELRAAFITKMITLHGIDIAADSAGHKTVETTRKYDRRKMQSLIADIGTKAEFFYKT